MAAKQIELVFIPVPGMGHLPCTVELARRLVAQFPDRISITFLILRFSSRDYKVESFIQSLKPNSSNTSGNHDDDDQITFLELPYPENPPSMDSKNFAMLMIDAYKPIVMQTLVQKQMHHQQLLSVKSPTQKANQHIAGLILDMACTTMIDVANELGIPSYLFFTSGASFLRMMLHFVSFGPPDIVPVTNSSQQSAGDEVTEVAGFKNPVPAKVWPDMFLEKEGRSAETKGMAGRYREAKGILVNTFSELEPHFIHSLSSHDEHEGIFVPPIYPVGPIINLKDDSVNKSDRKDMIMSWLDSQPPRSVLFLCFGSRGVFNETQLKEIAAGLEQSGQRFLWSITQITDQGRVMESQEESETEYFQQVLPDGFLARTNEIGKVIGWAPQTSVLGHKAVGAFVSHCGWNSILESIWFGVPLLTWPMYTEQQLNAFALVHELELAVELRIDYKSNQRGEANMLVGREEIEKGIRKVMDTKEEGSNLREKVKKISEMGQNAFLERSGSSYQAMSLFVDDVFKDLS